MEIKSTPLAPTEMTADELHTEANRLHQEILAHNSFDVGVIKKIRDFKSLINEYQKRLTQMKEELETTLAS